MEHKIKKIKANDAVSDSKKILHLLKIGICT